MYMSVSLCLRENIALTAMNVLYMYNYSNNYYLYQKPFSVPVRRVELRPHGRYQPQTCHASQPHQRKSER